MEFRELQFDSQPLISVKFMSYKNFSFGFQKFIGWESELFD